MEKILKGNLMSFVVDSLVRLLVMLHMAIIFQKRIFGPKCLDLLKNLMLQLYLERMSLLKLLTLQSVI